MGLTVSHCCTMVCSKSLRNLILGMEKKMETTIVHWGYLDNGKEKWITMDMPEKRKKSLRYS